MIAIYISGEVRFVI